MKYLVKSLIVCSWVAVLLFSTRPARAQEVTVIPADSVQAVLPDVDVSGILVTELGNVARESESIAQKYGIKITAGSGEAAAIGAEMAARTLKEEMYETVLEVGQPLAAVKALIQGAIVQGRNGRLIKQYDGKGFAVISGTLGSGFLNMNPAVIISVLKPRGEHATIVLIKGYAKEGLIKQHTARKAVEKITAALYN